MKGSHIKATAPEFDFTHHFFDGMVSFFTMIAVWYKAATSTESVSPHLLRKGP